MLTERQLFVLQVLIDDYIRSAEPVGSRSISKREDVTFSPATIRNDLSDLEEMGFLEKTHSSSGRVPSEKGYRFYVDHLLSPALLTKREIVDIRSIFAKKIVELEDLAKTTARVLSDFTRYTSIVLGPEVFETKLRHIQIIPLSEDTAVAIFVTSTGHVENRTISIPAGVDRGDLEKFMNILNERLSGSSLIDLKPKLLKEVRAVLRENIEKYEEIMEVFHNTLSHENPDKLYFGGKTNILSQPEFHDIEKVRLLFNAIEQEDIVHQLLQSDSKGIQIKIGHENAIQEIANCSVITADYSIGDHPMGHIAIIGPTRMEYRRVISLLDLVSKGLSDTLTERYQSE
ncbi:MAG TPA: heat-inducible transcriptional repressor HrcA [Bacillales bacterium]|nr:heat-inducible transcriptional repressor HrcA [Bacillales bacterium]